MKKTIILLYCLMTPVLAICQKEDYSFGRIVEKLSNKAWIKVKECKNGSCHNVYDQTYYFFRAPKSDDYSNDTLVFRYVTHDIRYNEETGKFYSQSNVCNPIIVFFNSPLGNENFSPIFKSGWAGRINGEISFKNDSEFVLLEHILKTDRKGNFDKNIERKSYYKLTTLPDVDN